MHPYVLTFITNAAVLVFEITGARLVAPYFGASTDIWSAIIATVIGGLSLGYYFGGAAADRGAVQRKLTVVLSASGIYILLIGAFHQPFLSFIAAQSTPGFFTISGHALLSIVALFFVPSFLLGIVYPLLVKQVLTKLEHGGHDIGVLSAVGAVGSIVGSLGAGLVLLPLFGSRAVIIGVGAVLVVLGLLTAHGKERYTVGSIGLVLALAAWSYGLHGDAAVLADIDSAYSRIVVREEVDAGTTIRTVQTDAYGIQCAMYITALGPIERLLAASYLETMRSALNARFSTDAEPEILFLGGCNYSLPRAIRADLERAQIEVVEIDPAMTAIAERFFGFDTDEDNITVIHEDGRVYLNNTAEPRDAIVLDAFGSGPYIPFHLTTREMLLRSKENLTDDGVLLVNLIGGLEAYNGKLTGAFFATLSDVFSEVRVYQVGEREGGVQNLIFAASDAPLNLPLPYEVTAHVEGLSSFLGSRVLTDDRAPTETLTRNAR